MPKLVKKEINSFRYAFRGISFLIQGQHFRIHLVAALSVIVLGFIYSLSRTEWILITFAIALVLVSEGLNTSIELLTDLWTKERNPLAGKIKDIGAASVLLASIAAIVIGGIIFVPKILGSVILK